MGVRSSWLMLARKALLARLAVSAASLAVASAAVRLSTRLLQVLPMLGELGLDPAPRGDVQQDRTAGEGLPGRAPDHQLQFAPGGRRAPQSDLDGLLLTRRQHPSEADEQEAAVPGGQARAQKQVRAPSPLHPQHLSGRQIHLRDPPLAGECGIAHRGEVVEVDVAVARFLQRLLGRAQLPVLELQLDLVDLQLMDHVRVFGGVKCRKAQRLVQVG